MKKIFFLFAALCCTMHVQLKADATVLYELNGIHYVLVEMTFADKTTYSAYVVHPEATVEDEDTPTTPSSYTGEVVIENTISYEGNEFPVKFIDENAFLQSTITSIDLPENMSVFNSGAFKDCLALQTIICRAFTPPSTRIHTVAWDYENVFGSLDPEQVSVYVPEDRELIYERTGGWDTFTHYYIIGSTQGIEALTDDLSSMARKRIIDGQLLIDRGGKTFNAQGAEVK